MDRQSTQVPQSTGFMSALTSAANRMTVNTGAKKDQASAKEAVGGGQAELPKEMEKQNKDYCQLCYKSFGLTTFRYHCRTCGRSCCSDCSVQHKLKGLQSYRICEFCDIKNENPQLEEYYRLECQLR